MDTKKILAYLSALAANNEKEWFHQQKAFYQEARTEFLTLVRALALAVSPFDPDMAGLRPEDLIFRINRDTRFSPDKSPYHTAFRAHISPGGRAPVPAGYYLFVSPGRIFLGGGVFAQFPEITARIREQISRTPEEFLALLADPAFSSRFTLLGETLKNVPRGYEKDHPCGEYLKHKAWAVEYDIPQDVFLQPEQFLSLAAETCACMKPLNDYLNRALKGFAMPERN